MIRIEISINSLGLIEKYIVKGHANYASYGEDIVCSAVSVLAQTTLIALNEVCDIDENEIEYMINEEIGYLGASLSNNISQEKMEKAQIVFKTFEVGVKSIIESYPKYVTLQYREV